MLIANSYWKHGGIAKIAATAILQLRKRQSYDTVANELAGEDSMNIVAKVMSVVATTSLLLSQPASAAVRSIDSIPQGEPAFSIERAGASMMQSAEIEEANQTLFIVLFSAAVIAGIIIIAGDNDSPG